MMLTSRWIVVGLLTLLQLGTGAGCSETGRTGDAAGGDGTPDISSSDGARDGPPGKDAGLVDGGQASDGASADGAAPKSTYLVPVNLPACGDPAKPPGGVKHITSASDWKAVNDVSTRIFCVHPGDYTSAGDITLKQSGTAAKPRVIRFFGSKGSFTHPVAVSEAGRALVARIELDGASHWIISGMAIGKTTGKGNLVRFGDGATHNVLDRSLVQTGGGGGGQISIGGADNVVQRDVIRQTRLVAGEDNHCMKIYGAKAKRTIVVGNEIYDCGGDGIQVGSAPLPKLSYEGTVIADNDIYCDQACGKGENGVDLKGGGASGSANWLRIVGNRMWGKMAGGGSSSGSSNQALVDVSAELQHKSYVLVRGNILFGSDHAIKPEKGQPSDPGRSDHWSVVGNLIYDMGESAIMLGNNTPKMEIYFNTIIKLGAGKSWYLDYANSTGTDARCNVLLDAGKAKIAATDVIFSHNAIVGSTAAAGTKNVTASVAAAMLDSYCFTTRRLTKPTKTCIPTALPRAGSPLRAGCDPAVGSRADRGVDDGLPPYVGIDASKLSAPMMGALR